MTVALARVGQRGLYYEGPNFSPLPAVVTYVYDPDLYGQSVNCVVTLDGSRSEQEGWGNEESKALVTWRTGVRVIQQGEERSFPCIVNLS